MILLSLMGHRKLLEGFIQDRNTIIFNFLKHNFGCCVENELERSRHICVEINLF